MRDPDEENGFRTERPASSCGQGKRWNGSSAVPWVRGCWCSPIERALLITRTIHGAHHPDTAQILSMLAQFQAASGKSEARETARLALDALEHSLGLGHPTVRRITPVLLAVQRPESESKD